MNLINQLIDDQFQNTGIEVTRNVARAVVFNEQGLIGLVHVQGEDIFGKRNYYETPGGGMEKGETPEQAVLRELEEEIGYKCEIFTEVGIVEDYYNLLKRKNINHYFICQTKTKTHVHHESYGDSLIKGIEWMPLIKAIKKYSEYQDKGIEVLVKRRELPILMIAKDMLNTRKKNGK